VTTGGDYFERHPRRAASARGDLGAALWHSEEGRGRGADASREEEQAAAAATAATTTSEESDHGED